MNAEPRVVWMPGGVRTEIHLDSGQTGGAFCLLVDYPPTGWALPAHRHRGESETIYVVEGEFEMELDGERVGLSAGQTIHVPRGVIHQGANVGAVAGRRVVEFSPAGIERFFFEVGVPTPDREFDWTATAASAARHGWEFVAQPR